MIERFGRAKVWPWLALVVVLGVVGAFAADAIVDGKRLLDFPGRGALIAAFDQVQEVSNADPPARSSREAEKGTSFAKQLSAAFHNAAEKVLPCVVTIVNTPPAPSEKNEAAEDDDNGGFNPGKARRLATSFASGESPSRRMEWALAPAAGSLSTRRESSSPTPMSWKATGR